MRSARMLLATATATAALAITAPAAYAETMGDRDHDTTSYSKEHHKDGDHHAPRGGVHTGGGALAAVTADDDWDSGHDKDGYGDKRDKDDWGDKRDGEGKHEEHGKDNGHEKGSWEGKHDKHGKHDKPRGGMHTGGGALAAVNADDDWDNPKHDPDTYKDGEHDKDGYGDKRDKDDWGDKRDGEGKHEEHGKHDGHEKGSWEGKHDKHDKPRGGMHTGGGGLASAPGVTTGGLAALAVAGTGLYALRRQKASRGTV
ncbi:hypothetical protein ACFU3E_31655 [Streptomyces sp. NPDC057424]|uniref:hypothetical protein n=1 Tax=Streptomyces sp. NPDC057424 TaxID=3346127 RepID=UPI00368EAF3E